MHAGGDGRTAREYAGAVGMRLRFPTASSHALRVLDAAERGGWHHQPKCGKLGRKQAESWSRFAGVGYAGVDWTQMHRTMTSSAKP